MSDEPLPPESEQPKSEQPEAELPAPLGATPPPLGSLPTAEGAPPPPPPSGSIGGTGSAPVTRRRRGPGHRRSFDFGRVLGGTFTVYFKKLPSILVLSLIIAGPLGVLQVWLESDANATAEYYSSAEYEEADEFGPLQADTLLQGVYISVGVTALEQLAILILGGALAYLVVRHQQGRSVGVGEALGRGFSRLIPILGSGLLVWVIAVAFFIPAALVAFAMDSPVVGGLLMLAALIPFMMFMYSAFVAVPACAVEKLGPVASLRRSRALCIGYRWLIFALALVMAIIGSVIGVVGSAPFLASADLQMVLWVGKVLEVLVVAPLMAILAAMIYVELRAVKEGVDPDGIAEVFA